MRLSSHLPTTFVAALAVCALVGLLLQPTGALAQSDGSNLGSLDALLAKAQCSEGRERIESRSVIAPFTWLGVPADASSFKISLFENGRLLFEETYSLEPFEASDRSAVELWLGGINSPGHASWSFGNDLAPFTVELDVDDVVMNRVALSDLFAADETSRGSTLEIAPVTAIEHIAPEPAATTSEALLFEKSTFVCPNAIPYCDYEYDACENNCYAAGANVSASCLQACNEQFLDCYYGEPVNRIVLTPVQKTQNGLSCRRKNCQGLPRTIQDWQYKERKKVYQSTYCRTTGQTHNETLVSNQVLPTVKFCNKDQPFSLCPFGQPVMGCYSTSDLCPF